MSEPEPVTYRAPAKDPAEQIVDSKTTQINAVCAWCKFRKPQSKGKHDFRPKPLVFVVLPKEPMCTGGAVQVPIDGKLMWAYAHRFDGPVCLAGCVIDPVLGTPTDRSSPHECASKNDDGRCTDYQPTWWTVFNPFRSLPMAKENGR